MDSVANKLESVSLSLIDINLEEEHRRQRKDEIIEQIGYLDQEAVEKTGRICPDCKSVMHRHGKTRPKEVWTLAGMIHVSLSRLRCSSCGCLLVPGSEIIADELLSSLAEVLVELCRYNTFATTTKLLKKLYGIDIPVATLHSYIQRQASYFSDEIVEATADLYEAGIAPRRDVEPDISRPLYLSIDEGLVREWSWYHNKQNEDEGKRFVITYCAVFFDGREKISGPGAKNRRYKLTNRFGHASATTDIDQFFSELVMLSYRRGYTSDRTLFILTDGARYLTGSIASFFPQAIALLDLYHLKKRIFDLVDIETRIGGLILQAVHCYDPVTLVELIKTCPILDEKHRQNIDGLITYIKRNAQSLKNHRHPQAAVHGSASAEKAVDLLVARRFKNRGMSWTKTGCEVLLQFQVLAYNNELDDYWNARHNQNGSPPSLTEESSARIEIATRPKQPKGVSPYYHQVHLPDSERTKCGSLN